MILYRRWKFGPRQTALKGYPELRIQSSGYLARWGWMRSRTGGVDEKGGGAWGVNVSTGYALPSYSIPKKLLVAPRYSDNLSAVP